MSYADEHELSNESILNKLYKYILGRLECVDLDDYVPYIEILRHYFVPSIEGRVHALLEHYCSTQEDCNASNTSLFGGVELWLRFSDALKKLLRKDGLELILLDSIVLSNRLDRIRYELGRLGFNSLEIDWCDLYDRITSLDYWLSLYRSLSSEYSRAFYQDSQTKQSSRQSRKRKATYEEVCCPYTVESWTNPFDPLPFCSSFKDQRKSSNSRRDCHRPSVCSIERRKPRSDKLKVVVIGACPAVRDSRDDASCRRSENRRRRTGFLKLPFDFKALKEKLFKTGCCTKITDSKKLNERLQSVCDCLNKLTERLANDVLKDSSLSCNIRKNHARFKLECIKSKACMFSSKVVMGQPCKKKSVPSKRSSKTVLVYQCGAKSKEDVTEQCCGKSSNEDEKQQCSKKNSKGVINECAKNNICKDDEQSANLGKCETEKSIRILWDAGGKCLDTSSFEENASCDDNNILSPMRKENKKNCDCNTPHTKECISEKVQKKCANKCNTKNKLVPINSQIPYLFPGKRKEFKDSGVMTVEGKCCRKADSCLKDVQTNTDDCDDIGELTNIYINEICLCVCGGNDEEIKDVASNTVIGAEEMKDVGVNVQTKDTSLKGDCSNLCVNSSTNTESTQFQESSTQVLNIKDILCCVCNTDKEREIKNVKLEHQVNSIDNSCKCDKGTSTDEKFTVLELDLDIPKKYTNQTPFDEIIRTLNQSPRKQAEFTGVMKTKISEIINLNEKIREKFTSLKQQKESCSVSVQTLTKESSSENVNIRIQVKTSVVSLKSNPRESSRTKRAISSRSPNCNESQKSNCKFIQECDDSTCELKKDRDNDYTLKKCILTQVTDAVEKMRRDTECGLKKGSNNDSQLKKSILTEVTASLEENPVLNQFKNEFDAFGIIHEKRSIDVQVSKTSCCNTEFDRGDAPCYRRCDKFSNCQRRKAVHRSCRCSRKSHFLSFLSDHFTRDAFERCKRILRSIFQKILEKGRMFNESRRPRKSKCSCSCCREANYFVFPEDSNSSQFHKSCTYRYEKSSATRLIGGGSNAFPTSHRRRRRPNEYDREFAACTHASTTGTFKQSLLASACRDAENRGNSKNRVRNRKRRSRRDGKAQYRTEKLLARVKSTPNHVEQQKRDYRLVRNRRIETVASKWKKPYDIYDVSSGSLPSYR